MSDAKRFDDLPERTKEFLTNLRDEEIDTLTDGIRLVNAVRTVGTFIKWVIIGLLGILSGIVMFGETLMKIAVWFKPH
jgi:hypothetical protein